MKREIENYTCGGGETVASSSFSASYTKRKKKQ